MNWITSNHGNLIALAFRHHECLAASGRKTSLVNNFLTGEYKEFDSRCVFTYWLRWIRRAGMNQEFPLCRLQSECTTPGFHRIKSDKSEPLLFPWLAPNVHSTPFDHGNPVKDSPAVDCAIHQRGQYYKIQVFIVTPINTLVIKNKHAQLSNTENYN